MLITSLQVVFLRTLRDAPVNIAIVAKKTKKRDRVAHGHNHTSPSLDDSRPSPRFFSTWSSKEHLFAKNRRHYQHVTVSGLRPTPCPLLLPHTPPPSPPDRHPEELCFPGLRMPVDFVPTDFTCATVCSSRLRWFLLGCLRGAQCLLRISPCGGAPLKPHAAPLVMRRTRARGRHPRGLSAQISCA